MGVLFIIVISLFLFLFGLLLLLNFQKRFDRFYAFCGKLALRYFAIYLLLSALVLFKGAYLHLAYSLAAIAFSLIFILGAVWFSMTPPRRADGKLSKFKQYNAFTGSFSGKFFGTIFFASVILCLLAGLN